ncbi:MAG: 50S ribosomal protein L11 methyltransferase [Actinomycetota bacterium]|nr:50S ribosomal protein L11 methyltransferase [Actinomycetota bacterium]
MTQRYTIAASKGVEQELLLDALWSAGALGVWERGQVVVAWFPETIVSVPPGGRWEPEPERDWLAEWKTGLEPVRLGRLTLTPSWHPAARAGPCTVVIDPGMAFGTGHHATTRLCLSALERADLTAKRVLDVGTGSGVLAIAAARLGAEEVVAVDVDPDAVSVAAMNATRNEVAVDVRLGSLEAAWEDGPFDIVVANLSTDLVLRSAAALLALTVPDGLLVVSGIASIRNRPVRDALRKLDAKLLTLDVDDEWAALTVSPPGSSEGEVMGNDVGDPGLQPA